MSYITMYIRKKLYAIIMPSLAKKLVDGKFHRGQLSASLPVINCNDKDTE